MAPNDGLEVKDQVSSLVGGSIVQAGGSGGQLGPPLPTAAREECASRSDVWEAGRATISWCCCISETIHRSVSTTRTVRHT
eukprot:7175867-Prymnesium_polylepis.1